MTTPTNELHRSTLILLLISVAGVYPLVAATFGSRVAIETANVVLLSLASGVVVAYAPVALSTFRTAMLDGAAILSLGIFIGWSGVTMARGGSIVWRLFDKPPEWLDSAVWGTHIVLSILSALCHMIAPEAVSGKVPTRQWVRIGLMVAAGVFAGAGLVLFNLD